MRPQFKIVIDGTTYENDVFQSINVKRRENNYDVATLIAADGTQALYDGGIVAFDDATVELKADAADSYSKVFGGRVRQVNPVVSESGKLLTVNCKGYGDALEETHCNRDYGVESSNPSYPKPWNIWKNIIADFTNKSFADSATGHTLTNSKVTAYFNTNIKYINNPYRANIEVIDTVCALTSAIGAGTTAGAHWIVDADGNFLVGKIGDHAAGSDSPETEWPDWWNTDQAGSTLVEGTDFVEVNLLNKTEEYANNVLLLTDFRRPTFDYWTESNASSWGNDSLTSITDEAGLFVVGANSLKLKPNGATFGQGYYPSSADAAWNVAAWGSPKTIPTIEFYCYKHLLTAGSTSIIMSDNTTARKTDYWLTTFMNWESEPDDKWLHKSVPIGPYWATKDETRSFRWTPNGAISATWENIDSIEFNIGLANDAGYLLIDDLHFAGKIIRSARSPDAITANKEAQKVIIARNCMDDSCVASDDTGFAGRIAYAELLRRLTVPKTVTFAVSGKPSMMAGQKCHVHALKKPNGDFALNSDMRILTVEHNVSSNGFISTVTATSDLMNSNPINQSDQYAMWMENMFLNSNEAKNIRAGAEVDLLIPMLRKDY